jgi:hypothetical protein
VKRQVRSVKHRSSLRCELVAFAFSTEATEDTAGWDELSILSFAGSNAHLLNVQSAALQAANAVRPADRDKMVNALVFGSELGDNI